MGQLTIPGIPPPEPCTGQPGCRCADCGRRLTDPKSVEAKRGPVCRGRSAVQRRLPMHTPILTQAHIDVWHEIEPRRGKENAVPVAEIVRRVPFADRHVRALVKELLEEHRKPIGSCKSGFYVIETAEESRECRHTWLSWGLSAVKRACALKNNARLRRILGQLELEIAEEEAP